MADHMKNYPDINFVDTDTNTLTNAMITAYELLTGRTLYPADPTRIFILWIADIIVQERVNIDFSAKQNLPRYAEGAYLDSIAELFKDAYRLAPEKSKTTLEFTLSVPAVSTVIVPAGTRATVDGEIVFVTLNEVAVAVGSTTVEAMAACSIAGAIGNGFLPGQINQLIDIFPYYKSVKNTTISAEGTDEENDAAFYERMRGSLETFSTAGPIGSYEYFAKSASALIADVKATSLTAGTVDIRILLQGGALPGDEILKKVTDTLTDDKVRPLTDRVIVAAPIAMAYDIDLTYYTQESVPSSAEQIATDVTRAVNDYKAWQSEKIGRDLNPSYLISLVMKAGAKRVDIRSPVFTVTGNDAVAVCRTTTILNGGTEHE